MFAARFIGLGFALAALCLPHDAVAGTESGDCTGASFDCAAVGQWNFSVSLGAGVRTNPLVNGRNIPLVVVPHVSYYGRHFFLDNLDLGVTFCDRPAYSLSLIATPGADRIFFARNDPQNYFVNYAANSIDPTTSPPPQNVVPVPHARQFTYLAGLEGTVRAGRLSGQLELLQEVTGRHHGSEIRGAVTLMFTPGGNTVVADVGALWKSEAVVGYYYGESALYDPGSALDPFFRISWKRPLSGHWQLSAFVNFERLGKSIADSPIVANSLVTTGFAGATYIF